VGVKRAAWIHVMSFTRVLVGGFTSNVGKTTLVCELLGALRGWEAIKTTRGHYRSCGKDPHACCVSHLLGDEPSVRTGRAETYTAGKDTGRYWDAGASNVHWVIATDAQVGRGISLALERVASPGVLIEGNSPVAHIDVDFFIMAARADDTKIKPTARRALAHASALYLTPGGDVRGAITNEAVDAWRAAAKLDGLELPLYTPETLLDLIGVLRGLHAAQELSLRPVRKEGQFEELVLK
jgi:molybdopterin-guanine dinucleotide biosynthesis protein